MSKKDGPPDYVPLRAWGAFMGSLPYYINDQVAVAREDNAPQDVIYHRTADQVRAEAGDADGDDQADGGGYFTAESGRVWARWRPDQAPVFTREQMARHIHNYETTGGPHG